MTLLEEIIAVIKPIDVIGNRTGGISGLVRLDSAPSNRESLFWCKDQNLNQLSGIKAGVVVCGEKVRDFKLSSEVTALIVPNPRLAFLKIAQRFFPEPSEYTGIHPSAVISPTAHLGKNVCIAAQVVIESDCSIGDNSSIGPNTVLHRKTIIGKDVKIGANNTIGGVGFGYEINDEGVYEVIPHLGNVVIEDRVEIGNNTAIDRAVLGSTLIKEDAKIDNLVHVAHGVTVGRNTLVIAHAMIGGSTSIGDNVWVAPTSAILNGITVGSDSVLGMGAVVLKPVAAGDVIIGNPGRKLRNKFSKD